MGAAILDFFATGVFFDDLEIDAFLFSIVTIIALTDFDLPGWNTVRRLVALRCCSVGACCAAWGCLRTAVLRAAGGAHGCCCCVGCVARTIAADFARLLLLRGLQLLVAAGEKDNQQ